MKTWKKIGGIALDVLIVLVFVVSVILIVSNLTTKKGEEPNVFGYVFKSVQSTSMSGTFEKGALVIGKIPDENTEIIVGESIITFKEKKGERIIFNTHRVVDSKQVGGLTIYQTQGDNRAECFDPDQEWKSIYDIEAVYVTHIPLLGGFIDFLKSAVGFVLLLVLPMLAFIGYQIYKLITLYMAAKKEEMLEEAKAGVSDDTKDAIIKEYLAKMQAEQSAQGETKPPEPQPEASESEATSSDDNT